MAAFLYFLPGRRDVSRESVESAGITAVDDLSSVSFCETERGPDGGAGIIFAVEPKTEGGKLPKVGYYPKNQQWSSCNNAKFWLGVSTEHKPTPEDLLKTESIAGHSVVLADNNLWTVPLARSFPSGSALPKALVLGPNGELVVESLPEFAKISEIADEVYNSLLGESDSIDVTKGWDMSIQSLSLNYRLSKWEASALKILSTRNVTEVLEALVDVPSIKAQIDSEKKRQLNTDSSKGGA